MLKSSIDYYKITIYKKNLLPSCSLLDEGVVVNLGMFKPFVMSGTFGGIRTFEVDDRTILVVVIVIGESQKLELRLVMIGLMLSSVGKLAAFLRQLIQLFRIPSVIAEKTIFLDSKVLMAKPKFRGNSVFSTC